MLSTLHEGSWEAERQGGPLWTSFICAKTEPPQGRQLSPEAHHPRTMQHLPLERAWGPDTTPSSTTGSHYCPQGPSMFSHHRLPSPGFHIPRAGVPHLPQLTEFGGPPSFFIWCPMPVRNFLLLICPVSLFHRLNYQSLQEVERLCLSLQFQSFRAHIWVFELFFSVIWFETYFIFQCYSIVTFLLNSPLFSHRFSVSLLTYQASIFAQSGVEFSVVFYLLDCF